MNLKFSYIFYKKIMTDQNLNEMKIHFGSRGNDFVKMLVSVFEKAKMSQENITLLTSNDALEVYNQVFTSKNVDENNNYEMWEQLGDLSINKFIVWYFYERFPQLACANGTKVIARLKINYMSKDAFSNLARKLNFWDFITELDEYRTTQEKSLLEDVFEAFIGATECFIDKKVMSGCGYVFVYRILKSLFDDLEISLEYNSLFDAKTRLKEIFDLFPYLGKIKYIEENTENGVSSTIYREADYQRIMIGNGIGKDKSDAQQKSSENAIIKLEEFGIKKAIPNIYKNFTNNNNNNNIRETTIEDIKKWGDDINLSYNTKKGMLFGSKNTYTSTILNMFCRQRNLQAIKLCISLFANPQIRDCNGLTCLDLVLIGKSDKIVEEIFEYLISLKCDEIHKKIFDLYFSKYSSSKKMKSLSKKLRKI